MRCFRLFAAALLAAALSCPAQNPLRFDGGGPYTNTDVGFRDLSHWQGQG